MFMTSHANVDRSRLRIDIFMMLVALSRPLKKGADSLGVLYIGPGALHYIIDSFMIPINL